MEKRVEFDLEYIREWSLWFDIKIVFLTIFKGFVNKAAYNMSLREKTLNGAKWSAIATVIIIGLGLIQMTVLARIIDNHQFGLLTVALVIIAPGRHVV